jgi:hypothetical protein
VIVASDASASSTIARGWRCASRCAAGPPAQPVSTDERTG